MKVRLMSLFLLVALFATVGTAAAEGPENRNFRAHLNGDGAGVDTLAQGQAIFQFSKDGTELDYKLIVANIENVWMAHIHLAQVPGGDGPPVVWLFPDAPPPPSESVPEFNGVLAEGTVDASDLVGLPGGPETLDDLRMKMEAGLTYVNVHTNDFEDPANSGPGDFRSGEIRGDIH